MDKVDEPRQEEVHSLQTSRLAGQIDRNILPRIHFLPASGAERKDRHQSGEDNEYYDFFREILECQSTTFNKYSSSLRQSFPGLPFHEQITAFEHSQQLTEDQSRIRWQIVVDVLSVIRSNTEYRKCDATVFGSLATGLSNPVSDIDISIDIDGNNGKVLINKPKKEQTKAISDFRKAVVQALKNAPSPHDPEQKFFSNVATRDECIWLRQAQTGITIDLAFHNLHGTRNTKLLQFYINFEPRTKQLIVFLTYWAKFHKLFGANKLKKWSLTILILVFLMEKNMIPSVLLLQAIFTFQRSKLSKKKPPYTPDSAFCDDPEVIKKYFTPAVTAAPPTTPEEDTKVFLDLLGDFFKTIVNTEFSTSLVCSQLGQILRREAVVEKASECINALPTELGDSWNRLYPDYFKSKYLQDSDAAMFIPEPFKLKGNTAGFSSSSVLHEFVTAARRTMYKLRKNVSTVLDLFVGSTFSQINELVEITKYSESKQYFKMLLKKYMKPESKEEAFKQNAANEIQQAIKDISWVPNDMFEDLEQYDVIFLEASREFLSNYMIKLYEWKMLGAPGGLSSWQLKWQVTALWGQWAKQSMEDCFTKALNLAGITMNEVDVDCPIGAADTCIYGKAFIKKKVAQFRDTLCKIAPPTHAEVGKQRVATLTIPGKSIKYGMIEVKVTYRFWRRTNQNIKNRNAAEEEKISLQIYKDHLSKTTEKGEEDAGTAADFIPFFIYVLYKLDSRAEKERQECGISSMTLLVQEFNENDVLRDVCLERVLARKSVMDIIQRTFESYQLDKQTEWLTV